MKIRKDPTLIAVSIFMVAVVSWMVHEIVRIIMFHELWRFLAIFALSAALVGCITVFRAQLRFRRELDRMREDRLRWEGERRQRRKYDHKTNSVCSNEDAIKEAAATLKKRKQRR